MSLGFFLYHFLSLDPVFLIFKMFFFFFPPPCEKPTFPAPSPHDFGGGVSWFFAGFLGIETQFAPPRRELFPIFSWAQGRHFEPEI